jgi:hypothetical protein
MPIALLDERDKAELQEQIGNSANAIKNTASGTAISLTDISPLEHILTVKARSKNLIDFSKPTSELRLSSCTLSEDGKTLTSKFTNNNYSQIIIYYLNDYLLNNKGKTITFSVKESYSDVSLAIVIWGDMTTGATYQADNSPTGATSFSLKISENFTSINRIELRFNRAGTPFTTERTFSEFQLELNPTKTPYAPYVDVSTANVSKCGKNLMPYPFSNSTTTINGITFTDSGDGTITANGTATENAIYYFINEPFVLPKGTYTLSGSPVGGVYETYYIGFAYTNDETNKEAGVPEEGKIVELEKVRAIYIVVKKGITVNNLVFKPQLEKGTAATEYEPYTEPTTYNINADGTVEGVTSLYPATTLMSDTEGVVIDVEYNADTKKYIDNKFTEVNNRIAELAAAIVNS